MSPQFNALTAKLDADPVFIDYGDARKKMDKIQEWLIQYNPLITLGN